MSNLSIKNAPERVVKKLKIRAAKNHRSLQGEMLAILEAAVDTSSRKKISIRELADEVRARGFRTPDEGVEIIRAFRDGRQSH